ncbi:hypothetical protein BsWGS_27283 [Bradybaena similaris]
MAPLFECLGKTPFASLLAALLVIIGTCVFCGTSYRALQIIIIGVFQDKFRFSISSLEVLQVMFVIIGVIMGVFAIVILIFGFLATGATRSNVYSGAKCIMGGRITAAFFIILSYILTIGWMAVLSVCVVSVVAYAAVDSICSAEIYSKTAKDLDESHYCFNITRFGIYDVQDGTTSLCGYSDVRALCNKVIEAGPLFCVACAAAGVIIIGMIHFLVTLAANYTRIKISKELTEYRDAVEMEELELHSSSPKGLPPYIEDGLDM